MVLGNTPGTTDLAGLELAAALIASLGVLIWAVPGLALTVPGLIVILTIHAQAGGGLLWVPLVRRKIGSFGSFRGAVTAGDR